MARQPLPATGLPGLEALFNGGLWARWAESGRTFAVDDFPAAVRYIRLKPRTSCRVAVFRDATAWLPGRPPLGTLLYLLPDQERAQEFFDKRLSGKLWGKPTDYEPFLDRDHAIVAMPFPNDREVPGLRHVYRHHRLNSTVIPYLKGSLPSSWRISRSASDLQLVRYKVGRRAVLNYRVAARDPASGARRDLALHLKVESKDTFCPHRAKALRELADAVDPTVLRFPEILGADQDRLLTVRPWYAGHDLEHLLEDAGAWARAGRALRALHDAPAPASLQDREDLAASIARETEALIALIPEQTSRIRRVEQTLVRRLPVLEDRGAVPVHGDPHPGQVIDRERVAMWIDFDRCRVGSPAVDIGSFFAHADEQGIPTAARLAFADAYQAGVQSDREGWKIGYALGLFRRCARPFRELVPTWSDLIRERLEHIERVLHGAT